MSWLIDLLRIHRFRDYVLVLAATLVVIGTGCGAVFALGSPAQDAAESVVVPTQVAVESSVQTTATSVVPTTSATVQAHEYPDYRPDPSRISTARAQSIGKAAEAALGATGFEFVEAVEFTPLDSTDPVTQIALRSESGESRAMVAIWIFKTPENQRISSPGQEAEARGSDEEAKIPGYGSESVSISGASSAYCVTGPFGSYCQIVAQLPDGTTINVCSESGELRGGTLPLDRAGVEGLLALLIQELRQQ